MEKNKILKDRMHFSDEQVIPNPHAGLWARTEIVFGHGEIFDNPNGKSTLGEEIFRTHNIVPVGGVSYAMENIYGVKDDQIIVPTLYSSANIGKPNSTAPTETYDIPGGKGNVLYRYGNFVQLFGVGITGTAENDITTYEPGYRDNSINLNTTNADGLSITGTMLPFRYTHTELSIADKNIYFGKKVSGGITGYYLKRFASTPSIKHIWKTGEDNENEEIINNTDIWKGGGNSGKNEVESFTEFFIKITKHDIKEWFASIDQEKRARINTIALFSGEYVPGTGVGDNGDYRDVRMYSKLCMNPEYLDANKDLNMIYRVYGS